MERAIVWNKRPSKSSTWESLTKETLLLDDEETFEFASLVNISRFFLAYSSSSELRIPIVLRASFSPFNKLNFWTTSAQDLGALGSYSSSESLGSLFLTDLIKLSPDPDNQLTSVWLTILATPFFFPQQQGSQGSSTGSYSYLT